MYNKFDKYLKEEGETVATTSADVAPLTKRLKKPLKTKEMETECSSDKSKNESVDFDDDFDNDMDSDEQEYMCNDDFNLGCDWCGPESELDADENGDICCPKCGSSVSEIDECDNEEDDEEDDEEDEYDDDADIDGDGEITADDVYAMVDGLSKRALIEIIDLIASYLENKFEEPGDRIPNDGKARFYESVIRKLAKDGFVKKSSKLGHKLVGGKEKPMNKTDAKKRVQDGISAGKKRKSKPRK